MAATAEQLTRTLTSKKRNLTRHVNAAGKTIAYALLHPTEDAATEVRQVQDRVDKSYGELMDTIEEIISETVEDEAEEEEWERAKQESQDKYEAILERCLSCLETIKKPQPTAAPAPAPAQAAAGAARAPPKTNDSLKPDKLQGDNTPAELRTWIAKFKSYYNCLLYTSDAADE